MMEKELRAACEMARKSGWLASSIGRDVGGMLAPHSGLSETWRSTGNCFLDQAMELGLGNSTDLNLVLS